MKVPRDGRKTSSAQAALNLTVFLFFVLTPFATGPTVRYALCLLVTLSALGVLRGAAAPSSGNLLGLLKHPLFLALCAWNVFALVSVPFSPEPAYSIRVYFSEFFANSVMFAAVTVCLAALPRCPVRWKDILVSSNVVFLVCYVGLMGLWLLFPAWLPFSDQELACRFISDRSDLVFEFGRTCSLFHGIHHISLFLALMIAFWSSFPLASHRLCILFLVSNFSILLTTTRRGAIAASLVGLLLSFRLEGKRMPASSAGLVALAALIVASLIFATGLGRHFVREDWSLISKGRIEEARHLGGSIPLRLSTYREFVREIASQPFRPRGIGKKFIKEYWQPLVRRAGLQHGHNTFINQAFYMGIQGALALAAIIFIQWMLMWNAMKKSRDSEDRRLFAAGVVFLVIYWVTNLFTDAFRHDSASLYWLFTALATGRALWEQCVTKGS